MSCFTDQKPFVVSKERLEGFQNVKKRFNCKLCGHDFKEGDTARWVYANFAESPVRCGNFFVCGKCDAPSDVLLQCAKLGFEEAVKLAKRWNIYGPEWQSGEKL